MPDILDGIGAVLADHEGQPGRNAVKRHRSGLRLVHSRTGRREMLDRLDREGGTGG